MLNLLGEGAPIRDVLRFLQVNIYDEIWKINGGMSLV